MSLYDQPITTTQLTRLHLQIPQWLAMTMTTMPTIMTRATIKPVIQIAMVQPTMTMLTAATPYVTTRHVKTPNTLQMIATTSHVATTEMKKINVKTIQLPLGVTTYLPTMTRQDNGIALT